MENPNVPEEKTSTNLREKVRAVHSSNQRIIITVSIDPKDLKEKKEVLIEQCHFNSVSSKISNGFEDTEEIEAKVARIFYFGANTLSEAEVIAVMKAAGCIPGTLKHLLAAIKAGLKCKYIVVALGSRYMNEYNLNPALIPVATEDAGIQKDLRLVTEEMFDGHYALIGIEPETKKGLCD
ncbi:MAG: hypothetical protein WC933_01260 [Candidatus Paceibacterota bacterium]|jgi:hypothetical protein